MVENAHPILRWFGLGSAMNWSHLPVAGGLYEQHPDLLDGFQIIFAVRAEYESREIQTEERQEGFSKTYNGQRVRAFQAELDP